MEEAELMARLSQAYKEFSTKHEFKAGQIVRQKPGLSVITFGNDPHSAPQVYRGPLVFVEKLNGPISGCHDSPLHPDNLTVGDCVVIAPNAWGGCSPILMDTRFIEPDPEFNGGQQLM